MVKNRIYFTCRITKYRKQNAISAISYESNKYLYSDRQKWREIYGTKFPE